MKSEKITALLAERVAEGDFPSAVYLVASAGNIVLMDAVGDAVRVPERIPATTETIYDLASLTKPLITGLLCARRVERGELSLEDRVSRYLAEFDIEGKRGITLRQLLTHTSGLPAWRPFYLLSVDSMNIIRVIADEPLVYDPGTRVMYSDPGFIALGILMERLSGLSLREMAQREIFEPLGLSRTFFNPSAALKRSIAASENGNVHERTMSQSEASTFEYRGWRDEVIWGEVHDGNAWFLGGAAGHAGIFSSARETLRLAEQFVPETTVLLNPETCSLFRENMTSGLDEARSFAWQLAATKDSTAGLSLSADSFGHLGFTGTSCWIDAAKRRFFILLTNRTHDRSEPVVNINSVRRRFHTLAAAALDDASSGGSA